MGELLRSVFSSPQRAEEAYTIGTEKKSPATTPGDRFNIPTLQTQIASIEQYLLTAYNEGVLANDDWVVQQVRDRGIQVYDDMLDHDPQVFGCFESLSSAAAKSPFKIKPGDESGEAKEHAEFVKAALDKFDLVTALQEIAHGEAVGFSVSELVYEKFEWRGKTKLTIRSENGVPGVYRLPASRVVLDYLGRPKLLTLHEPVKGAFLQPNVRFVCYRRGGGPYGDALLKHAFQPYWFKRNGNMFLAKFIEMFGVPPIFAFHKNQDELAKNLVMLKDLRSSSYGSLPNGTNPPTIMQPGRDSNTLNNSLDFYNDEISRAINGGTRTMSSSGAAGAYSATETHADQADDRRDSLVRRISFVLNQQLIPFLIRINFGVQRHYPKADYEIEEQVTPNDYMNRVDIWAKNDIQAPLSKQQFYRESGFELPLDTDDEIHPTTALAKASQAASNFHQARASRNLTAQALAKKKAAQQ